MFNQSTIKTLLVAAGLAGIFPAVPVSANLPKAVSRIKTGGAAPAVEAPIFSGVTKSKRLAPESTTAKADFTVKGADALVAVYSESFDNGMEGWTIDPSDPNVTWTTQDMGSTKSFSAIEAGDKASLYVDGPYQTFKRAKSGVISPVLTVPTNGVLTFYVGYSLNYNDVASLTLSVSDDGFATEKQLWSSLDEKGEKPWAWRYVTIDVADMAGKQVQLKFLYGPGTSDSFGMGGYLGDYAIDALKLSGMKPVESVDVMTGEEIALSDLSTGDVKSWLWTMPGAVPETSAEANPVIYYTRDGKYDISLTVTDGSGATSTKTCPGFVTVTGTEPVARIIPPATFRLSTNRLPLVAPLVPVTFRDGSKGFPTERQWSFMHVTDDPSELVTSEEENPEVAFAYLHDKSIGLAVANQHGASLDTIKVTAEYSGVVTNMRPTDAATTFDMGDWGIFPGSNTRKITAYAERFSAPSRPIMIPGAYVFFNRADAESISDQIANVGVHLYTSENGLPGKRIDSFWWSVYELDLPSVSGEMVGTAFPFTDNPIVDGEFFIVVDGIPEFTETCAVSFGMAKFRGEGNTAYMLKDGTWMGADEYFPAGANHTSFMVYPQVIHSVMASLAADKGPVTFDKNGGKKDYPIFSCMGYDFPVESDATWLRATGEPNGMTVDDIHIECDPLPDAVEQRTGKLTLTDGASTLEIPVVQTKQNSAEDVTIGEQAPVAFPSVFTDVVRVYGLEAGAEATAYTAAGVAVWQGTVGGDGMVEIDGTSFPRGIIVVTDGTSAVKAVKK